MLLSDFGLPILQQQVEMNSEGGFQGQQNNDVKSSHGRKKNTQIV